MKELWEDDEPITGESQDELIPKYGKAEGRAPAEY
jgi:hypothetical protein